VAVSGVSDGGGELLVKVNGTQTAHQTWKGGTKLSTVDRVEIPYQAGSVTIEIDNQGPDWVQLAYISIPGIARGASAVGAGNTRETIMRIERPAGLPTASIRLGNLPLGDGYFEGTLTDLATGSETRVQIRVTGGIAASRMDLSSEDSILWLKRQLIRR
jgi:hypothetical protein